MADITDYKQPEEDFEAEQLAGKRKEAAILLARLTAFNKRIAGDTSGDPEFDIELHNAIEILRASILRWIAVKSSPVMSISDEFSVFETSFICASEIDD